MKQKTLPGLLALLLGTGCVSHTSTVYRDVDRTRIEFESDAAARLFYETLSKGYHGQRHSESDTQFSLPIVFSHERKVVTGPNTTFNEAVAVCDSNQDGKITELEARVFANQH